jgi:4-hydroxybenzoate polyprenyltransferase
MSELKAEGELRSDPPVPLPQRRQRPTGQAPAVFTKIRQILEMIRFSHTVFALPFALLAAVMAWTSPTADGRPAAFRWQDLVGILFCMVAARSAAMAFNRLADHRIDAVNPRTRGRHLPTGQLSVGGVALFTIGCCVAFVAASMLFLPNRLPLYLSVPVLSVLLLYSFTKRVTWLAHYWLGFSLMLAPLAVWIALRGEYVMANPFDLVPALLLGLAVMFWSGGFDIIYACQDFEFDRQHGLRSLPVRLGVAGSLKLAAASHLIMLVLLAVLPVVSAAAGVPLKLGALYYLTVAAVAILLVAEHRLVRPDDLTRVNIAFFNINAVISFGLLLSGVLDTLFWN